MDGGRKEGREGGVGGLLSRMMARGLWNEISCSKLYSRAKKCILKECCLQVTVLGERVVL